MTAPLTSLTATWSNGATVFNAIKMNVTDTGHAAGSKLLDLQVGGTSQFNISDIGSLTIPGTTVTTNRPVLDFAQTWNAGAVAFTGIKLNVTNTASAAGSRLLDLQIGGSSGLIYEATGNLIFPTAATAQPSTAGVALSPQAGGAVLYTYIGGAPSIGVGGAGSLNFATDTFLLRDSTNILAQRNGVNANTFRVYNTFTDASNYERAIMQWSSNDFYIGTEAAGTGTMRRTLLLGGASGQHLQMRSNGGGEIFANPNNRFVVGGGGVDAFYVAAGTGALTWATDNVADIGAAGANRPRRLYLSDYARIGGTTVTASTPVLDLTQTWNAGAVAFTGIKLNVTNTASAAGSKLIDLQAGGFTQFSVDSASGVTVGGWNNTVNPSVKFLQGAGAGVLDTEIRDEGNNSLSIISAGSNRLASFVGVGGVTEVHLGSNGAFGWTSATSASSLDTILARDAANIIAQRNGTNANTFRVYNTFTDASNYERGVFDWTTTANTLTIGTEKAGTGTQRNLKFIIGGTNVMDFGISASLVWTSAFPFIVAGTAILNAPNITVTSAGAVNWGSSGLSGPDVGLFRDAANILAQRNLANAQTFRVYNTFTDASNYERGVMDWTTTANTLTIGTQNAGTGSARDMALVPASGSVKVTGGTVTTSHPVFDMTQTWNAGAVAFTALKLNVTNTASAANSALLDLQLGGSSKFKVANNSGIAFLSLGTGNASAVEIDILGSNANAGTRSIVIQDEGTGPAINIGYNGFLTWANADASPPDVILTRDAADTLAQRRSTVAQAHRVYNTFTDASNYERGVMDWTTTANTLTIGTQNAGTGAVRPVKFIAGGGTFLDNGVILAGTTAVSGSFGVFAGTNAFLYANNSTGNVTFNSAFIIGWPNGAAQLTPDTGLNRAAAKVVQFNDGAQNANGWMQWAGQARVTGDVNSNNTTTLALVTGLSVALQAGRTYEIEVDLSFTCTAAQGIRAALVASGGLTATNIIYDGWIMDSGANGVKGNAQATALGTVVANAVMTGTAGHIFIRGMITVGVAGSLQVHFAQSVAAANNTTVKQGSNMIVYDMP